MTKRKEFYVPHESYAPRVIDRIRGLPKNGVVIFDVEDTALTSGEEGTRVRSDFDEVHQWMSRHRSDVKIGFLTYRTRETGTPELDSYKHMGTWHKEDVIQTMGKPDKVGFLQKVFANRLGRLLFIDDSPEGEEAERQGFGLKV